MEANSSRQNLDVDSFDPVAADGEYLSDHSRRFMIRYLGQMTVPELNSYYDQYTKPHLANLWLTRRMINLKPEVLAYIDRMDAEREDYLRGLPHTD